MVRANHEQLALARDHVLGDHAGARLRVAAGEVAQLLVRRALVLLLEAIDRGLDIEGPLRLRLYELERRLRVLLVVLDAVGEANRDEVRVNALLGERLDGKLCEATSERGIEATADAEHE